MIKKEGDRYCHPQLLIILDYKAAPFTVTTPVDVQSSAISVSLP